MTTLGNDAASVETGTRAQQSPPAGAAFDDDPFAGRLLSEPGPEEFQCSCRGAWSRSAHQCSLSPALAVVDQPSGGYWEK